MQQTPQDELCDAAYEIVETREPHPWHLRPSVLAFLASEDPYAELFGCLLAGADEEIAEILKDANVADAAWVAPLVIVIQCEGLGGEFAA
jgi:hypothetical protein